MRFVVLPGDGIGPEISEATIQVLEVLNRKLALGISFETHEIGLSRLAKDGSTFPDEVLEAARAADGIILGPVSHSDYPARDKGGINGSAHLRVQLDLYANIRPCRSREGLAHYGRTPLDLVIVRENTEGFYADRTMFMGTGEYMPTPDVAIAMRKVTAKGSRRIAKAGVRAGAHPAAAEADLRAQGQRARRSRTRCSSRSAARSRRTIPDIAVDDQLIDSMTAMLVRDAQRFDVVVTTNMFGDILSDLASELSGSLGLGGAINAGDAHCMAQAQHGSAPDIQGQDKANPCSLVLSAAMLLDWLADKRGLPDFRRGAEAINRAVDQLVKNPGDPDPRPRRAARHHRLHPRALRRDRAEPLRWRCSSAPTCPSCSRSCRSSIGSRRRRRPGSRAWSCSRPTRFRPRRSASGWTAPGCSQVLFNTYAGDRAKGERGMACIPGPRARVPGRRCQRSLDYAVALECRLIHFMAGVQPDDVPLRPGRGALHASISPGRRSWRRWPACAW